MQYTFANQCFACLVDEALVLLSTVDNRYLAVNPIHLQGVTLFDEEGAELRGSRGIVVHLRSDTTHALLKKLASKGLIGSADERTAHQVETQCECKEPRPRASLIGRLLLLPAVSQVILLIISRRVQRLVRGHDLRSILHSGRPSEFHGETRLLPQDIRRLCVNYEVLKRLLPRTGQCLVDSLTMAVATRMLGHHAEIMFGVKAAPFAAHCWPILSGTPLLASSLTEQEYQPIMRAELRSDVRI